MLIILIKHNKGLKESKLIKDKIRYRAKKLFVALTIFCDPIDKAIYFQEQRTKIIEKVKQIEKNLKLNILELSTIFKPDKLTEEFPIKLTKDPFYEEMQLQVIGDKENVS